MKKRLRQIIAAACIWLLVAAPAHALIPVAIGVWYAGSALAPYLVSSAIIHVGAASAYLAYQFSSNHTSWVNPSSGQVTTPAEVIWVPANDIPNVVKAPNNVQVPFADLQAGVNANTAKYPNLAAALQNMPVGGLVSGGSWSTVSVGDVLSDATGKFKVTSKVWDGTYNCSESSENTFAHTVNTWSAYYKSSPFNGSCYSSSGSGYVLTPHAATASEFASVLSSGVIGPNGDPLVFSDQYGSEIDDFIQSNPNIIQTAEPMPAAATAQQLANYNAEVAAAAAAAAREQARLTAEAAAGDARARANTAASAAAANPGDAGLQAEAGRLDGLADAAEAAAAGAGAAAAGAAAEQAANEAAVANIPPVAVEGRNYINLDAFRQLSGAFSSIGPIPLLSGISSTVSSLVQEPVAPNFDLPVMGQSFHVDLSIFDPVAAVIRWTGAMLMSIGSVFYVVRFWRGVS